MKPVVLTLKFKVPAEFRSGNLLSDDPDAFFDNEYYAEYFRTNINDAEVVEMNDYTGVPDNQPEGIEPGLEPAFFVDYALFLNKEYTLQSAFEDLKKEISGMKNFDIWMENHYQVENNHYLFAKEYSFNYLLDEYITVYWSIDFYFESELAPEILNFDDNQILEHALKIMPVANYLGTGTYGDGWIDEAVELDHRVQYTIFQFSFLYKDLHLFENLSPVEKKQFCISLLQNKKLDFLSKRFERDDSNSYITFAMTNNS